MLSCLRVYLEGSVARRIGESPVVCVDKQKAGDGSLLPGVFALPLRLDAKPLDAAKAGGA